MDITAAEKKLKIRVYRAHVAQTLNWYQEELTRRFGPVVLSEAQKEIMRREFSVLCQKTMKQEKTNSWQVPLTINFKINGQFQVNIDDEKKILYLD